LRIHEYQAKALLQQNGISVPRGKVAATASEVVEIARELGCRVVVKAQVYAGGRGKAGGVKLAGTPEEAGKIAEQMLGKRLVTHQTTAEGVPVNRVLVEEAINIKRELYLGIVVDTGSRMPVFMASEAGGMDIEEVAATSPEKILKAFIDPSIGFQPFQARRLAYGLNLSAGQIGPAAELMTGVYRLFQTKDCSLAEINPLVTTTEGKLIAADAKLNFDDNALFRHPDIQKLADPAQEDPLEVRAWDLGMKTYIKLSGNIGCMVNGAGLSMAVLDMIAQAGGSPANFLDIGTANNPERVVNAFRCFVADKDVKVVLVNIFGGIGRVDVVAQGVVDAYRILNIHIPVVVRLAGTGIVEARRIMAASGIKYIEATDSTDAARKAVAAVREVK
jgi:succinyl-CoA synthetase beta subunit